MNTNDKYFDMTIKYYTKMFNNTKLNNLIKKLFCSTHLSGAHLDFYHLPYSFGKNTPIDNFKKFQRKMTKSMNNLLICEKKKIYLSKYVIFAMIEQIELVLKTNDMYWQNYGFVENEIINIKKSYNIYLSFLQIYIDNHPDQHKKNEKIYQKCIKKHLGINISPKELQKFSVARIKYLISKIEQNTKMSFFDALNNYKSKGTPIQSETELTAQSIVCIMKLSDIVKKLFENTKIILPDINNIKVKPVPTLTSKYSTTGNVSGRYLFLNMTNIKSFKKESLIYLCAKEVIPGNTMVQENITKSLALKNIQNLPKRVVSLINHGTNSIKEGFSIYVTKFLTDTNYIVGTNMIDMYFLQLFNAINILIDTGINSNNVDIQLDFETAKSLLQKMTLIDDISAHGIVLNCLSSPANLSSHDFGYCMISQLEQKLSSKGYSKIDFCKMMYESPFSLDVLFKYVDDSQIFPNK